MSIEISLTEAKAKLSELLAMAEAGKDIVITRAGLPVVRLAPVADAAKQPARPGIIENLVDPTSRQEIRLD